VGTANSKPPGQIYDGPIRNTDPQLGPIYYTLFWRCKGHSKLHGFGAEKPISWDKLAHFDFFGINFTVWSHIVSIGGDALSMATCMFFPWECDEKKSHLKKNLAMVPKNKKVLQRCKISQKQIWQQIWLVGHPPNFFGCLPMLFCLWMGYFKCLKVMNQELIFKQIKIIS